MKETAQCSILGRLGGIRIHNVGNKRKHFLQLAIRKGFNRKDSEFETELGAAERM